LFELWITQTDPLARTSGSYLNAYEYANVNPMVFVDPSGLRAYADLFSLVVHVQAY
jgi:hypothetical protein